MSRFDLDKFDGEEVLNGELKVGTFTIVNPTRYMVGDRIHVALELIVDEKAGVSFVTKDSVLTRRHGCTVHRVAVIEDDELLDTVTKWWLERPLETDEYGTEPMIDNAVDGQPTEAAMAENAPDDPTTEEIVDGIEDGTISVVDDLMSNPDSEEE